MHSSPRLALRLAILKTAAILLVLSSFCVCWTGNQPAHAVSMCNTRVIEGTTVRECYDAADSYATFETSCGTRTYPAEAASNGGYPTDIIPCRRSGPQAADPAAARRDFCNNQGRQARDEVSAGNDAMNKWNPSGAIPHYERAISMMESCDDKSNAAIVQRSLDTAKRQYAAVQPDNRVGEAIDRFGTHNSYDSTTAPFSEPSHPQGGPAAAPLHEAMSPASIAANARARCDYLKSRADAWRNCMLAQEVRAILESDPAINAACGWMNDTAAKNNCALQAYAQEILPTRVDKDGNCYFLKSGQPCYPGGSAAAAGGKPTESLRESLARKMRQDAKGDTSPVTDDEVDAAKPQPPSVKAQPPSQQVVETGSPGSDSDDPLQNYLQSRNNGGSLNNGALVNSDPNFKMNGSETDRAVNQLQGPAVPYGPPVPKGITDPNAPKARN